MIDGSGTPIHSSKDDHYPLPTDEGMAMDKVKALESTQPLAEEKKKNTVNFEARNLEKLRQMQERKEKEIKQMEEDKAKILRRQEKLK